MKNIFSFINLENLKNNIRDIILRFPLWVLIIIIITTLFIVNIHVTFTQLVQNDIYKYIISLIVTFFLSISVYISTENSNITNSKRKLFQIIPILFWIFFYFSFEKTIGNIENIIFIILSLVWIISYLFFAPYIKKLINKDIEQTIYYTYFYKISVVFLTSIILWIVLFILWYIAISAVFSLFDITWTYNNKIISDWTTIALSFISPLFLLTQIPNKINYNENKFSENPFFSFLTKYIAIPFIYVYFVILYAYSIKVLSNFWEWPKWEVSWLVVWFSTFWFIIYIFSYIFEETNKFIKTFRKSFPFVVVPQLFMLFYAIYLRINQYDITINRYFVVVFWIWLSVLSVYFIFSKIKHLSVIPIVLTLFTIIISVWPWSVYNLPESRQYDRLVKNLETAWILKNETIIPLKNFSDINQDLSKNIYSWVDYVCQFNNCEKIISLFPEQYNKLLEKSKSDFEKQRTDDLIYYANNEQVKKEVENRVYNLPSEWEISYFINNEIKVKNYFDSKENLALIDLYASSDIFPLDVSWYSKIYSVNNFKDVIKNNSWYINIDAKTIEIRWENWEIIDTIDIKDIIDSLITKYNNNDIEKSSLEISDLTFVIWNYKIIFNNLSIRNPDYKWDSTYVSSYANWYILIK